MEMNNNLVDQQTKSDSTKVTIPRLGKVIFRVKNIRKRKNVWKKIENFQEKKPKVVKIR